jgi:uncharacterized protein YukE
VSDLKADTARIRECSDALKRIHDEFANHANPAQGYSTSEMGSSLLVGAFDEFGSNWKIHREQLKQELDQLAQATEAAANTYDGTDAALAKALRDQDKPGASGNAKGGKTR